MTDLGLRPVWMMTDEELMTEAGSINSATDTEALRNPVALARHLDRKYKMRAHVKLIGEALGTIHHGSGDRLLITCPPQVGKSVSVAIWFPFWWLCLWPEDRIIIGSYNNTFALARGRSIRKLVNEHGHRYGIALERGSQAANDWQLVTGGGVKSVGVGGGVAGAPADCVPGETIIVTPNGEMRIDKYVNEGCAQLVLSYNCAKGIPEWRPVQATRTLPRRNLVEVVTHGGRVLRCTPDHLVFTGQRGYVPASQLQTGDRLTGLGHADLPALRTELSKTALRSTTGDTRRLYPKLLRKIMCLGVKLGRTCLRALRCDLSQKTQRNQQGKTHGLGKDLLWSPVPSKGGNGESLTQCQVLSCLRYADARDSGQGRAENKSVLFGPVQAHVSPDQLGMRTLRDAFSAQEVGSAKTRTDRIFPNVLLAGMPTRESSRNRRIALFDLWRLCTGHGRSPQDETLLLSKVQALRAPGTRANSLRTVRRKCAASFLPDSLLRPGLQEPRSLLPDIRKKESALPSRSKLHKALQGNASADLTPRQVVLRRLQGSRQDTQILPAGNSLRTLKSSGASHQRERARQHSRESDHTVPALSPGTSQVCEDTVAVVRPVRGQGERVYDLQVEENCNFFANQVLVHNCVIIDDPHKSRAEADSLRIRDKVYDWMSGDINTRRQPKAPLCMILTRWHEDDIAGRMLKEQGRVEEGGRWRVIHMPAYAGQNDPLGREPGAPLPHPKIHSKDIAGLTAHWNEKRATSTVRDWHALYMGDPKPTEGALVTEQLMRDRTVSALEAAPPVINAVAVDPSGGGRDEAGILGGFRGTDNRVYWTHDLTGVMATDKWARTACELAWAIDAEMIIFENTFGGDQAGLIISTAWEALCAERKITKPKPRIVSVPARKNKRLRAEPVAQQIIEDRVRLVGYHPETIQQWTTWMSTDTFSPGRIDASVYLTLALLAGEPADVGTPAPPGDTAPPPLPVMPGTPHRANQSGGQQGLPGLPGMPTRGIPGRLPTAPGMPRPR